jgi:eukaryotic-like serine/threonine-protein kinase
MENVEKSSYDDWIGRTLLGRYQIVRRLAAGGMGIVYLARAGGAAGFAKPVVIKRILPGLAENREFAGMFVREAQILSYLHHPGIVDVLEFTEEDGDYIMVLEYVHGFQLGQWNRYLRSKGRQIPTSVVIQIIINTLDALHHAHMLKRSDGEEIRIIHRDISPSNILIGTDGRSKLVDFGIARVSSTTSAYKTESKSFKGKLSYTAPEIFQGGAAGVKSDVYSCGVVLHEILIGVNDFRGEDYPETLGRVLNHEPVSVHGFRDDSPDDIDAVIGKALVKNPDKRYGSAAEFAAALREIHKVDERKTSELVATLVQDDFNADMAAFLEVESLDKLDKAWRNPSIALQRINPMSASERPEPYVKEISGARIPSDKYDRVLSIKPHPAPEQDYATKVLFRVMSVFPNKRSFKRVFAAAVVALFVAFVAGVVTVTMTRRGQKKEERRFLLVQSPIEPGSPAQQPPSTRDDKKRLEKPPKKSESTAAVKQDEGVNKTDVVAKPVRPVKQTKESARENGEPDVQALTRAFRSREKEIHSCVETHAVELQGKPKVSVLFQVDQAGKVKNAEISPNALSETALGACILSVARSTQFPPQKEEISFHIPVTVWRVDE